MTILTQCAVIARAQVSILTHGINHRRVVYSRMWSEWICVWSQFVINFKATFKQGTNMSPEP